MDYSLPRIPEWYSGQRVLISGATGFMGRVLVEKLLRSCHQLDKIYVIVRSRRGLTSEERWAERTSAVLFDRLRRERPGDLERKVKVVEGDMEQLRLGLTDEDYEILKNDVTVMFHVAASVRFNDPFRNAVFMNVRSTREMLHLAQESKHLKMFVHVSTAFSNCYQPSCDERVYPPPMDWKVAIKIAERCDGTQTTILQNKVLGKFPNTYTFTKNLAESLVSEYSAQIPSVIVRPSIVVGGVADPFPGWVDNLNGPCGLILAGCTGLIRTALIDGQIPVEGIPVDVAIQGTIAAPWFKSLRKPSPLVYTLSIKDNKLGYGLGESQTVIQIGMNEAPLTELIWYPSSNAFVTNQFHYKINSILYHFLPAILIGTVRELFHLKPLKTNLLRTHIKIQTAFLALKHFNLTAWDFSTENYQRIRNAIHEEDKPAFPLNREWDIIQHLIDYVKNMEKVILKQKLDDEEIRRGRFKLRRFYWLDWAVKTVFKSVLLFGIISLASRCFVQ